MSRKFVDMTGRVFGKLTVVSELGINKYGKRLWKCVCECGNEVTVIGSQLSNGNTKSCGCSRKERGIKDELGNRYGRLVVLEYKGCNIRGKAEWLCECDCGDKVIIVGTHLRNGNTKSCGCIQKEKATENCIARKKYNKYELSGEYGIGYDSSNRKFLFDLKDYDKIKDYCWNTSSLGYMLAYYNESFVSMSRIIMDCPKDMVVDHINGSETTNDNRRYNLRICTQQHNMWNTKAKGIDFVKRSGKWRARIDKDGKSINLGYFTNKQDAIKIRKSAELVYFEEFAFKGERLY